jgi:hypothetical protein
MAALEATIEIPNGRANGYNHAGVGAACIELQDDESLIRLPPFLPVLDQSVSGASEPTAKHPQKDRTATAAAVTKAHSSTTAASQTKGKPATAQAAEKSKPAAEVDVKGSKIKYLPQAQRNAQLAKLRKLSDAALSGDNAALDALRSALDGCPYLVNRLSDLQIEIERKFIKLLAGKDPLRIEAFRKRSSEFRHQLLDGEPASFATKMAASRVVASWTFAQLVELRILTSPDELSNLKTLEQAERRFAVAMRTFNMTRQMDLQLQRLAQ